IDTSMYLDDILSNSTLYFSYYLCFIHFFFNDTAPTEIYTLSLHDALPIWPVLRHLRQGLEVEEGRGQPRRRHRPRGHGPAARCRDRKSTRLNSSHDQISYAVFCLKKKNKKIKLTIYNNIHLLQHLLSMCTL